MCENTPPADVIMVRTDTGQRVMTKHHSFHQSWNLVSNSLTHSLTHGHSWLSAGPAVPANQKLMCYGKMAAVKH